MRRRILTTLLALTVSSLWAETGLTLYNQQFAVVRESLPLELKQGENQVRFSGVTAFVEPETVMLRDPSGEVVLRVLEQNYLADPVSLQSMLVKHEGQTIQFQVRQGDRTTIVDGKIIRAGTGPQTAVRWNSVRYQQPTRVSPEFRGQPIVEVNGQTRFQLPGIPLFPSVGADALLKPTVEWVIESSADTNVDAELAYLSGGLNWECDYNIVAPVDGEELELIGWVTMQNQSGKSFEKARVKLMAGEVSKLDPRQPQAGVVGGISGYLSSASGGPQVTEKTFDEYHLYSLERAVDLRHGETKQVEFLRAAGIDAKLIYLYDGAKFDTRRGWQPPENIRQDPAYGALSNPKVWVMREFANSEENSLGVPLPQGRIRFYRRDTDERLEFTGEDEIRHTPRGETVRVFTGAAFDLVGERKRTNFYLDHGRRMVEESFEIRVRNRKEEAVEVLISERLYRWYSWEIHTSSIPFDKKESQRVEFRAPLEPGEEKVLTYSVRYTW